MKSLKERATREIVEVNISIPTPDGSDVAEIIKIKVPALRDPQSGEIFLTGDALKLIDKTKARYMGLLLPTEIRELRERLGMTQQKMSRLLRIGDKTYTRWENGRERPSQSMNLLLTALWDGRLDVNYLIHQKRPSHGLHHYLFHNYGYEQVFEPLLIKIKSKEWENNEDETLVVTA
jgi:transcriptional regulator with XRE-family HTH domain